MNKTGKKMLPWILSMLSVVVTCAYPVIFLYTQNADEVHFHEVSMPLVYFCVIGIGVYALLLLVMRDCFKSALITSLIAIVALNFAALEKPLYMLFSGIRYWHSTAIYAMLLFVAGAIIRNKLSKENAKIAVLVLGGIFGLLVVMNFGMAVPTIINRVAIENETQKKQTEITAANVENGKQPNIYFILADEYAGFEEIKHVYGYDNEDFAVWLESKGFTVSRNSHNEAISTAIVTANLANIDYVVDNANDSPAKLNQLRTNGALFTLLREHGYAVYSVGNVLDGWGLDRINSKTSKSGAVTINSETAQDLLLKKTVLYPFIENNEVGKRKEILENRNFLVDGSEIPENNTFILAHFESPHQPFVFRADGSFIYNNDWIDPQYYLGQFQYTTKLLTQIVEAILNREPDAVVILQSDHGARFSAETWEDKTNILNAVYVGGQDFSEMIDQSGVNTLRLLMNRLFDCNYFVVEVP